jgi:hypothetical protein
MSKAPAPARPPRRHHLVPKFILERFAKDGALELVERDDLSKVIRSDPKNALLMKDFYTLETEEGPDPVLEKFFDTDIEGPAAEAFRRMVDGGRALHAPGIRDPISWFLAMQRVRGRASREMLVEHSKASLRMAMSMATPEMVLRLARERGEEMTEEEAAETAEDARSGEYEIGFDHEANLHMGAVLEPVPDYARMFYARTWRLLTFPDPVLVTCDEPVALIGEDPRSPGDAGGLMKARAIVFTIDPRHALVMVRADVEPEDARSDAVEFQAEFINRNVAFAAHRFIVRHPGTDPLRGVVLPKKAPSVVVVDNYIAMHPNATEQGRAKEIERLREMMRRDAAKKRRRG